MRNHGDFRDKGQDRVQKMNEQTDRWTAGAAGRMVLCQVLSLWRVAMTMITLIKESI